MGNGDAGPQIGICHRLPPDHALFIAGRNAASGDQYLASLQDGGLLVGRLRVDADQVFMAKHT